MAINVNNRQADNLTRRFAAMTGVGITDAIVIAMTEAIARRRGEETPRETAKRLREKHGIAIEAGTRKQLSRAVFDDMWEGR